MPPSSTGSSLAGSFRIFQVAGITVYLHWSWFLVAYLALQFRTSEYHSWGWNVAEYLTLFGIVLLHEFGHALACRQVGGKANEIVLWPLGGIAFVDPPARPGAWLWSIAAGPLVNLVLVPVTIGAWIFAASQGLAETDPDAHHFLATIAGLNLVLLVFNMLPIYPLDGGQILQALLWFFIGQAKSLKVVSILGLVTAVTILCLAVAYQQWWVCILAAFAGLRCWAALQQANMLLRLANAPRYEAFACPSCKAHPAAGEHWQCGPCGTQFDMFVNMGVCPGCGTLFPATECPECRKAHPIMGWFITQQQQANTEEDEFA
jgi:Zn-dependent protease